MKSGVVITIAGALFISGCTGTVEKASTNSTADAVTSAPSSSLAEREKGILRQSAEPLLTSHEYASRLVDELIQYHTAEQSTVLVAVTDFAFIHSELDKGSIFSNHLSEAIIYDLHKAGIAVLDYKVTDYIRVTETGDFVLSRDYEELSGELPINYVVTGTLTPHQQGILVNARLVQISTKQVISVARSFIPQHIVNAIIQHETEQKTLRLQQG